MKTYMITVDTIMFIVNAEDEVDAYSIVGEEDDNFFYEKGEFKYDFDGYIETSVIKEIPLTRGLVHTESH